MQIEDMAGRGAVVTGSGGGMGRSIALALADAGLNVVIADIDFDAATAVSEQVKALGVASIPFKVDVSKRDEVEALAEAAYEAFGDIAVLVNNAGVTWRPFRASWDATDADFEWMMNVNFWGVYNGHRAFVPRMRATAGPKHIINTSSMATLSPTAGHAAYTAAKSAVDGFSLATRAEYEAAAFGIGVSVLYPGSVKTGIGATSERLRASAEQAGHRQIIPWESYVVKTEAVGAEEKETFELGEVTHFQQAIAPEWVGPMVVQAIVENRPFIMTHPTPPAVDARATELNRSYAPSTAPTP
ncbi:SDR family NAD(P)-dependent oxidoreductase [Paenarthrobacter sp. CC6]|uniref:SDR family NAD(P)-dependent oxidoreductase n=1 Tax=Paenarthrobacter sp. CC6 TaxID=3029184 RepID=UPI00339C220F